MRDFFFLYSLRIEYGYTQSAPLGTHSPRFDMRRFDKVIVIVKASVSGQISGALRRP